MNVSNRYECNFDNQINYSIHFDYDANKKLSLVQRIKRALPFFKGVDVNIRVDDDKSQSLAGRVRAKVQNSNKLTKKEVKQGYEIFELEHVSKSNPHSIYIKVRGTELGKALAAARNKEQRNVVALSLRQELKGILNGSQSAVADFQKGSKPGDKSPKTWGDYFKALHITAWVLSSQSESGQALKKLRDFVNSMERRSGLVPSQPEGEQKIKKLIGAERERAEEARVLIDDIKDNLVSNKVYSNVWDKSDYKKAVHELDERLRNIEFILADDFVPNGKRSEKAVRKDLDRAAKELDQFASFLKQAFKLDEITLTEPTAES